MGVCSQLSRRGEEERVEADGGERDCIKKERGNARTGARRGWTTRRDEGHLALRLSANCSSRRKGRLKSNRGWVKAIQKKTNSHVFRTKMIAVGHYSRRESLFR